MKAIRVHAPGGPEVLLYEDVPDPVPGPRDVLVRVEAAGVNFIDVYHRTGAYKAAMPYTPGLELSGSVVAVGEEVRDLRAGDLVAAGTARGAYAELVVVPEERLVSVPNGVNARQAAAAMLQGMTAHFLATSTYPLAKGDTCLIHAGAGGVGLLLIQVAKMRGARVLTTVSTEAKAELARGAGADEVILYTRQDFVAEVARLTSARGVRVVYDSVGRATFAKSLECLALRGTLVLFGRSSGAPDPIDPQALAKGSNYLTRPSLFHHVDAREDLVRRASDVLEWVRDGRLQLRIGLELPLERAADAHRELEARRTTGKVLLLPA
jgi:NADPH:quinone reductase